MAGVALLARVCPSAASTGGTGGGGGRREMALMSSNARAQYAGNFSHHLKRPMAPVSQLSCCSSSYIRGFGERLKYHGSRTSYSRRVSKLPKLIVSAMDSSLGGEDFGPPPIFPRLSVRDPFKLLGVSRDASDEEIREARNYLSSQYSAHEKSREAIEAAYDKIIMDSFRDRRKTKINLKSSLKKKVGEAPPQIRALTNRIEIPTSQVILQRAALFVLLGVWSVMNPADGGPAFQVAVSLAACIFFLNDRLKSLGRAFLIGFGALVVGWVSGSFLVPVLSSYILPPSWNLELSTALFSYIFLWVACTFLK